MTLRATPALLLLSSVLVGGACDADAPQDQAVEAAAGPRSPLGKADLAGSCLDDEADFCGGQSIDRCWCDDLCESFGDCCSDYAGVCQECAPAVCDDLEAACGEMEDGCGGTLDCGPCPDDEVWLPPEGTVSMTLTCSQLGTVRVSTGSGCNSQSSAGQKPMRVSLRFEDGDVPQVYFDAQETSNSDFAYWEPRRLAGIESQPILLEPLADTDRWRGAIGSSTRVVVTASQDSLQVSAVVGEFNFSTCSAFCGCNSFQATCTGEAPWEQ